MLGGDISGRLGKVDCAPVRERDSCRIVTEAIERTNPGRAADPARSMHRVADRIGRRSLVIIVSDFLAPAAKIREGLMHLGHDRHELILLRVLHRDEVEFPFKSWDAVSRNRRRITANLRSGDDAKGVFGEFPAHADALKKRLCSRRSGMP